MTDLDFLAFAESIELAATELYASAAGTGKLDARIAELVSAFGAHHEDHAAAVHARLGQDALEGTKNQRVLGTFGPTIVNAVDQVGILQVLYTLEVGLTSTYLSALATLADRRDAGAVAPVLAVEAQHSAVIARKLQRDLASYAVPTESATLAFDPSDWPVEG